MSGRLSFLDASALARRGKKIKNGLTEVSDTRQATRFG